MFKALRLLFFLSILFLSSSVFAQKNPNTQPKESKNNTQVNQQVNSDQIIKSSVVLPKEFANIKLGADIKDVKNALKDNPWFYYYEREIPSLAKTEKQIISTPGKNIITDAYFIFSDTLTLDSISLFIDENEITYNTLYEKMANKYGRPKIKVNQAIWLDDSVQISIEKPLQIKYQLLKNPSVQEQIIINNLEKDKIRKEFLNLF